MQTWTMASGLKVVGRVVDYARKDVTIQQRRGKTYVNDRLFDNLPQVYQRMLPKLVAHFEKTQIDDKRGLDSWVMKLRGEPRTFTCEGVMLELENRDEYGVPFFFFSEADLKVLQPGWQRWVAAPDGPAQPGAAKFSPATASEGIPARSPGSTADCHAAITDAGCRRWRRGFVASADVSAARRAVLRWRSSCRRDSRAAGRGGPRNPGSWPGRSAKEAMRLQSGLCGIGPIRQHSIQSRY